MSNDAIVQRVYEIKLSGYDDLIKKLQASTEAFNKMDEAKKRLNESLKTSGNAGDAAEVQRLNGELSKLQAQIKVTTREAQLLAQAESAAAKSTADHGAAAKSLAPAVSAVSNSIEEYTGTIQQNIKAQLANNQSIDINKAAQKSVTDEMKKNGTATSEQINKLAKLKEEALLLSQSNKDLTTTIRNQAKEFLSSNGSIDEGRARINQLQKAYAQLSDAERASPFGAGLKKEIDLLEPKLKELEASIGLFQRNVGNYPSTFTPALKVLGDELGKVQAKIIQLPAGSKGYDELAQKSALLTSVTETLGGSFKSTKSEAGAYEEAARKIGLTFGTESEVFKSFGEKVAEGAEGLVDVDDALEKVVDKGSKASGVFGKMFSGLKNIANIIPGLGLSGIVGLLLVPLGALASAIYDFITKSTTAISEFALRKRALNEITSESATIVAKETVALNANYSVLKDGKATVDGKRDALQNLINLYPLYFGHLDRENASIQEITKAYNAATGAIRAKANAEASATLATEKQIKVNSTISTLQKFRTPVEGGTNTTTGSVSSVRQLTPEDLKIIKEATKDLDGIITDDKLGVVVFSTADFNEIVKRIDIVIEAKQKEATVYNKLALQYAETNQTIVDAAEAGNQVLLKSKVGSLDLTTAQVEELIKSTQSSLDKLNLNNPKRAKLEAELKKYQDVLNPPKQKEATASKLSAVEKDRLAEIEANYRTALAVEDTHIAELKKLHDLSFDEQLQHLNKIHAIDDKFIQQKITYLNSRGKLNAQEKLQHATFLKEQAENEVKYLDDLNAIRDKQFLKEVKDLQTSSENQKKFVSDKLKQQLNNPDLLPTERLNAERASSELLLTIETDNLKAINDLHKKYGGELTDNERKIAEGIKKIFSDLVANRRQSFAATIADIDELEKRAAADLSLKYGEKQRSVLNGNGSNSNKIALSNELAVAKSIEEGTLKLEAAQKRYAQAQENYNNSKTESNKQLLAEYERQLDAAQLAAAKAIEESKEKFGNLGDVITRALRKAFGFGKGSDEENAIRETLATAYGFAKNAMDDYYDSRRQRIEQDTELSYQRIDLEKEQLLSQAQSAAERDSIERQAAEKKKETDKAALEQQKKYQKAQAAINLGIQLSSIAVAAAQNPLNGLSFGIAGAIQYGAQAAAAIANYILNIGKINSAQAFARGGRAVPEAGNGRITLLPNIPTRSNGDSIYATLKPGEVVLNEEQQRKAGGPAFFRALKVPGFADGGFAGLTVPGESLKPPYNPSSFLNPGSSGATDERINRLIEMIGSTNAQVSETGRQVRNIKVQVVAKEVQDTNNSINKAQSVGKF